MSQAPGSPKKVAVFGAGKVGRLVVRLLAASGDYRVTVVDSRPEAARDAAASNTGDPLEHVTPRSGDVNEAPVLRELLAGHDYALSCAPFHLSRVIAEGARANGVSYLDLTEDVATTKAIAKMALGSERCFIPQCGLAPGFISIVAAHLGQAFDELHSVRLRVGALPVYPHNRFKYNLTWSTEGLINEYANPCEAVVDGVLVALPPLEGIETLSIDGIEYEAFNTSGGLGTLADSWAGKVRALDYKSIRYPGHRELLALLMDDLKFKDDRETFKRVLERSLPHTYQDVVIIFVTASGLQGGRLCQQSYVKKLYHSERFGEQWGAIQMTTASSLCAVLDLHAEGRIKQSGFVLQEEIPFADFIANRFGSAFA